MNTDLKLEHVFDTTRYHRGPGEESSGEQKKQRRREPQVNRLESDRVEISAEGRRAFEEARRAPAHSSPPAEGIDEPGIAATGEWHHTSDEDDGGSAGEASSPT